MMPHTIPFGSIILLKKSFWKTNIRRFTIVKDHNYYVLIYASIIFASVFVSTAVHGAEYVDAKVVSSEPVYYDIVNRSPKRVCRDVLIPIEYSRSHGGSVGRSIDRKFGSSGGLIGAITGAGLGSRIGQGQGKILATLAGGVLGARIGDRISQKRRQDNAEYKTVNQCETVFTEELVQKLDYYRVTVEVDGIYTTANARRQPKTGSTMKVLMK